MVRFAATAIALAVLMLASRANGAEIVLLDFWSPQCGPCLQMKPTIRNFEQAGYPIRQIDVTRDPMLARQYGVEKIPCFVMLIDNQEVDRKVGAIGGEQLQEMFTRAKEIVQDRKGARGESPDTPPETRVPSPFPSPTDPAGPAGGNNSTDETSHEVHEELLSATVRLRVDDAKGHSFGTGTIIDARNGQALVITCGHLFRDSQGKGPVSVELFEAGLGGVRSIGAVRAELIHYNLERDVALVGVWPNRPVTVATIAPKGTEIGRGDRVHSVGCNNGNDPTVLATRITSLDRYQGPANIEAQGAPVEGRSGGGLFNTKGELIGVCYAADYDGNEGLYAALTSIHDELVERGLTDIANSAAAPASGQVAGQATGANNMIVRGQVLPLTPVQPVPERESAPLTAATVAVTPTKGEAAIPQGLSQAEQAAWEEIMTRASTAEVICIIRPKEPGGQSEVITLDNVSPDFVRALLARQRDSQQALVR